MTLIITVFIPWFHHYLIDNAQCQTLEFNLNVPPEERIGEWYYQYYPHLLQEFQDRCGDFQT